MTGELFSSILVVIGAVFCAISAFGLVRLPDVYLRSHAATKSATFGVLCLLGGGFLYFWFKDGSVSVKLLLAILFVFITSPVAGHLNGRAAYRSGVPLWKDSVQNDLLPKVETNQEKPIK
ncbi:monovalent cation/H(+) antiporter subunit G [Paenibacillus typhae]|uniref:monovalent cation/H(+) antiporter subunit G n=1 Tax=Paenibacillus typhae TaxID=1174501 RepID=UPI001C8DACF0|nr:monovalent cation/H(+) antiporter subunit G [Paenibacillus typhae]MBY0012104.1 Na+/H+ antiporter subunit G [Paenibacillus typhae]